MIKKSVSKWLLLATIPILGQPPRDNLNHTMGWALARKPYFQVTGPRIKAYVCDFLKQGIALNNSLNVRHRA